MFLNNITNDVIIDGMASQITKIQDSDSKAFIRQCTDINHINQRNNVKKTNQIFLDEYMSGDPR